MEESPPQSESGDGSRNGRKSSDDRRSVSEGGLSSSSSVGTLGSDDSDSGNLLKFQLPLKFEEVEGKFLKGSLGYQRVTGIRIDGQEEEELFKCLQGLPESFVLRVYATVTMEGKKFVIVESVAGMLKDLLSDEDVQLLEFGNKALVCKGDFSKFFKRLLREIIEVLEFIHGKGFVFGDHFSEYLLWKGETTTPMFLLGFLVPDTDGLHAKEDWILLGKFLNSILKRNLISGEVGDFIDHLMDGHLSDCQTILKHPVFWSLEQRFVYINHVGSLMGVSSSSSGVSSSSGESSSQAALGASLSRTSPVRQAIEQLCRRQFSHDEAWRTEVSKHRGWLVYERQGNGKGFRHFNSTSSPSRYQGPASFMYMVRDTMVNMDVLTENAFGNVLAFEQAMRIVFPGLLVKCLSIVPPPWSISTVV